MLTNGIKGKYEDQKYYNDERLAGCILERGEVTLFGFREEVVRFEHGSLLPRINDHEMVARFVAEKIKPEISCKY